MLAAPDAASLQGDPVDALCASVFHEDDGSDELKQHYRL